MRDRQSGVVYYHQQIGALHAVCWFKSSFSAFYHFFYIINVEKSRKSAKRETIYKRGLPGFRSLYEQVWNPVFPRRYCGDLVSTKKLFCKFKQNQNSPGVHQGLTVVLNTGRPPFYLYFSLYLCFFFFFLFLLEKIGKHVKTWKTMKKMISTSKWCAQHLFAGQNTQQSGPHYGWKGARGAPSLSLRGIRCVCVRQGAAVFMA